MWWTPRRRSSTSPTVRTREKSRGSSARACPGPRYGCRRTTTPILPRGSSRGNSRSCAPLPATSWSTPHWARPWDARSTHSRSRRSPPTRRRKNEAHEPAGFSRAKTTLFARVCETVSGVAAESAAGDFQPINMDKLQIQGGVPLEGEVRISGAKNATLPILAGALLAEDPVVVANVPHLKDVTTTVELLGRMGATVTVDERMRIEVDASSVRECFAPYDLVKTMRASILVLGPLVARYGRADVSLPGGCAIGARPVNIHVAALPATGAHLTIAAGHIRHRAPP